MNVKTKIDNSIRPFVSGAWGFLTSVDLYDCSYELITDRDAIARFAKELLVLLEMRGYGEPQIVHFGEEERVAGYTLVQLMETSNLCGHFANATKAAYIDIFSCKVYDPQEAARFSADFFQAKDITIQTANRM